MIRFSVVKVGDKLEEIKDVDGKIEWNQSQSQSLTDAVSN
jgi:small subunit ribosomal protein S6